jgi:hypothetical protein
MHKTINFYTQIMKTKKVLFALLIILLILQVIVNIQVLSRASLVRICDESEYLKRGLEVYSIIFNNNAEPEKVNVLGDLIKLQDRAMDRPPFLFILQAFTWHFLRMFNISNENAVILIVNTLFLFIMSLSCYGIGLFLHNSRAGFLSAILVAFTPIMFEAQRRLMADLPLAAMLCLSVYILFRTDKFRSRLFSLCLGTVLAFSQLTRETFIFYIIVPFLYFIYTSFQQGPRRKVFCNIIMCLGLGIIIAGPVFLNPASFYAYKKYLLFSQMPQLYSNIFYYFLNAPAIMGYILLFFTLPLFLSSVINIRRMDKILLLWFLVPFIVLSVSPNQFIRFIMPIVPAYCLIVALELFRMKSEPSLKIFYAVVLVFVCVIQYMLVNYLPETRNILPDRNRFEVRNIYVYNKYYTTHKYLMDIFINERIDGKHERKVLALFGVPEIYYPLQYKFRIKDMPFIVDFPIDEDYVDAPEPGTTDWEMRLLYSDYIIDKEGGFMGSRGSREDIRGQLKGALLKNQQRFEIMSEIEVPYDGSKVIVYRKKFR